MEPKDTDKLQAEITKEYRNFAPSGELLQLAEQLWDEETKQATPEHVIRTQVMDPRIPKNEREWWAFRRIEELEAALLAMLEADSIETSHKAIKQAEEALSDELAPIKFDREAVDEILEYISPEDFETAIKSGLVKLTHKVPDDR